MIYDDPLLFPLIRMTSSKIYSELGHVNHGTYLEPISGYEV